MKNCIKYILLGHRIYLSAVLSKQIVDNCKINDSEMLHKMLLLLLTILTPVFLSISREVLHHLSTPKVVQTNPSCLLKTEVVCDRRSPSLVFQLIPSVQAEAKLKKIELNSENLSTLEILQLCNKHVSSLAPKETVVTTLKTKSEKKAGAGGKRR